MTMLLALLLAVVALVILVAVLVFQVVRLASDVRALRYQVVPELGETLLGRSLAPRDWIVAAHDPTPQPHGQLTPAMGSFLLWEWRAGTWHCHSDDDRSVASLPPSYPGAFDGDLAKTWQPLRA